MTYDVRPIRVNDLWRQVLIVIGQGLDKAKIEAHLAQ